MFILPIIFIHHLSIKKILFKFVIIQLSGEIEHNNYYHIKAAEPNLSKTHKHG